MHFHVPKPLHGWREFAGEVGIIVLGVLIALSAEQLVESIHWRHEVAAERASLLQEASDMLGVIAAREAQAPCVDRRLREIRTILEHRRGERLALKLPIEGPTFLAATRGSWQIALSGQALTHMPYEEKLAFSDAFGGFDEWDRVEEKEREVWSRLAPLSTPGLLTEQNWSDLTSSYFQAVNLNNWVRRYAPWALKNYVTTLPAVKEHQPAGFLSTFRPLDAEICKPTLVPFTRAKGI